MIIVKPLAIDLYCGLGGWAEGLLAEGYDVIGFDIERHRGPDGKGYPAQLVLQDVLTVHGSQFRDAALIVASPPCQNYSYLAMPWSRSKDPNNSKAAKALRLKWETEGPDNRLFDACFRIQREAIEAKSTLLGCWIAHDDLWCQRCFIPLVVENVRGAQPWVGRSSWNFGSFHLWGDVPALMPINLKPRGGKRDPRGYESNSGSWFGISMSDSRAGRDMTSKSGQKVPGFRFDGSDRSFQSASVETHGTKGIATDRKTLPDGTGGTSWFGAGKRGDPRDTPLNADGTRTMPDCTKIGGDGTKQAAGDGDWFSKEARDGGSSARFGSRSNARKMASALIAKIPFELSRHIAEVYYPKVR